VVVADGQEPDGLKVIDLGAGHSSSGETLCGRVIAALKAEALLNESVSAGYIARNWPPALKECGAWPLTSLRQSFLNGSLTRLLDPDTMLRNKLVEFVKSREFGLASGPRPDGSYERVWFDETVPPDEAAFETGVFLLSKKTAQLIKAGLPPPVGLNPPPEVPPPPPPPPPPPLPGETRNIRLAGSVPAEMWSRLGLKVLPKLRMGSDLRVDVEFSVTVTADSARSLTEELRRVLDELGVAAAMRVVESEGPRPASG
jgi:hypothetical protein